MERNAYQVGVTPTEYRALTLRRLMQVNSALLEQQQAQWKHTGVLGAIMINHSGFGSPKSPAKPWDVAPHAFPGENQSRGMSRERYEANMRRHRERMKRDRQKANDKTDAGGSA